MKMTTQGVRFDRHGLTVYVTIRYRGGAVRFSQVRVPWEHFDDSDAWAFYTADAKRRAELDGLPDDEPALPLDWV